MKFFAKLWAWLKSLWMSLDKKVEKLVPVATNIVQGLKKAVEDEQVLSVLEVIKFYIPGDTDDKIIDTAVKLIRKYAPKIALQLEIINSITGIEDVNEQMLAVVEALKYADPDKKSDYWHRLASEILKALADDKLTLGEAGALVEFHYTNYIKQK